MYDPLYDEIVTNTSDLMVYLSRHFFTELIFPLAIFVAVMITFLVDWSWMPISCIERESANCLEDVKKNLLE